MRVLVSRNPEIYYDNELPLDADRVAGAFEAALKSTHSHQLSGLPVDAPEPLESVKMVSVVKSNIVFLRSAGVYGDVVSGDEQFYDKILEVLDDTLDSLVRMSPDEHDALIDEVFALKHMDLDDMWHESEVSTNLTAPLTSVKKRKMGLKVRNEGYVTDAIFTNTGLLVSTSAPPPAEEKARMFKYRQPLELPLVPLLSPDIIAKQLKSLMAIYHAGKLNDRGKWMLVILASMHFVEQNLCAHGVISVLARGVLAVLKTKNRKDLKAVARELGLDISAVLSLGALGKWLTQFVLEYSTLHGMLNNQSFCPGATSGTDCLWTKVFGQLSKASQRASRAMANAHGFRVPGVKESRAILNDPMKQMLAEFLDGLKDKIVQVVRKMQGALGISPGTMSAIVSMLLLLLMDYHFFYKPMVKEAFLQRHNQADNNNWRARLVRRTDLLLGYFTHYYQNFTTTQWLQQVTTKVNNLRARIQAVYDARQLIRNDQGKSSEEQLDAENVFIVSMSLLTQEIDALPTTEIHGLPPPNDQFWGGDFFTQYPNPELRNLTKTDHYANFQVWKDNVWRQANNMYEVDPFFDPQGPLQPLGDPTYEPPDNYNRHDNWDGQDSDDSFGVEDSDFDEDDGGNAFDGGSDSSEDDDEASGKKQTSWRRQRELAKRGRRPSTRYTLVDASVVEDVFARLKL